jgi:glycosyltransferase involved in cell wall biosynthesis
MSLPRARLFQSPAEPAPRSQPEKRSRVAYIMSRFPKLTETFVLYEMLAVEQQDVDVEIYPLLRERARTMHPEAVPLVRRAHYLPLISAEILAAQLYFLRRCPRVYLATLWTALRANFGSLRFFSGALAFFPKSVCFARRMADTGVAHVHAHFASHPALAAFVIHRLTGIPFSFTAHGSDLHRDQHMLREKVSEADFVVSISEFNRRIIIDKCGEQAAAKTIVIHCGVDTDVFRPPAEPPKDGQRLAILCIGTLHEVKGQRYLIEAAQGLAEHGVDFVCELIGSGPDRPALERQVADAGLTARVHFVGECTREQVATRLAAADVVVAPSVPTSNGRREGIPVVLMEAAASGKPIVASGISGIPELVDEGKQGYLVPPRDVAALTNALLRLARDASVRRELGAAGREKVLREFDLTSNAEQLANRFVRRSFAGREVR